MVDKSFLHYLSKAIEAGRSRKPDGVTREELLYALLSKRVVAKREGQHGLERILRDQIRWSLPYHAEPRSDKTRR